MNAQRQEMVDAVKDHATKNYNQGGWDIIVECYTDEELNDLIGSSETVKEAISNVGAVMSLHDEHRKDIQAEVF